MSLKNNFKYIYIVLLLWAIIINNINANIDTVYIKNNNEYINLAEKANVFIDINNNININDILINKDNIFLKHNKKWINFGYHDYGIWLKIIIINKSKHSLNYVLNVANPELDYVHFYDVVNNKIINRLETGNLYVVDSLEVYHTNYVHNIALLPEIVYTVYIYVNNSGEALMIPVSLENKHLFTKRDLINNTVTNVFYGIFIVFIVIGLGIYISMKNRIFLYFSIYSLFVALFAFTFDNYSKLFVLGKWPGMNNWLLLAITAMNTFFLILLIQEFFKNRSTWPFFLKFLDRMKYIVLFIALLSIFNEPFPVITRLFLLITYAVMLLATFVFSISQYKKDSIDSLYILLAFTTILFSYTLFVLREFGIISDSVLMRNIYKLGFVLEVTFLFLAVVETYKEIMKDNARELEIAKIPHMRLDLFNNISQEVRTPLSLIQMPLNRIFKNVKNKKIKSDLSLIEKNALQLSDLIDQIIDISNEGQKNLELYTEEMDIKRVINEFALPFIRYAEFKQIRFFFNSSVSYCRKHIDKDKFRKVINNLLVNAFKNTRRFGSVEIQLEVLSKKNVVNHDCVRRGVSNSSEYDFKNSTYNYFVLISIRNKGQLVGWQDQSNVFQLFNSGEFKTKGSVIGLVVSREYIKLHEGEVLISSEKKKGTCFSVLMPLRSYEKYGTSAPDTIYYYLSGDYKQSNLKNETDSDTIEADYNKKSVLIFEEDVDMAGFMKTELENKYRVYNAYDFDEARSMIMKIMPDIVVCNVGIPDDEGGQLCRMIKSNPDTVDIPLLVISCMMSERDVLRVLNNGANAYLKMPLSLDRLLTKMDSLLKNRKDRGIDYGVDPEPEGPGITQKRAETAFLNKAIKIVEDNMNNPGFNVTSFTREMGMSRSIVHMKLKKLTNKSTSHFISEVRLRRAAYLLRNSDKSISEICYDVGFSDPTYFSRSFKKIYGKTPKEYSKNTRIG